MKNEALLTQYEASFGHEAKRAGENSFFMMRSIASCAQHASRAARRASLKKSACKASGFFLVGEDGFEPSKRNAADLQSVPFGHSGTPPYSIGSDGAGRRTRTPDLLITNQLLYRLSYTGVSNRTRVL